jgi:hypothetical protein
MSDFPRIFSCSFNKMGIPRFDHFLIDVEAPVNSAVDLINDVNGIIDGLKDAVAMVVGAYKVDIQIGVKDHDKVLLTIVKAADGSYPSPDEVGTPRITLSLALGPHRLLMLIPPNHLGTCSFAYQGLRVYKSHMLQQWT